MADVSLVKLYKAILRVHIRKLKVGQSFMVADLTRSEINGAFMAPLRISHPWLRFSLRTTNKGVRLTRTA